MLTALRLRLNVRLVVPLDAVEELLPALRVLDVLHTDVHALLNVAVANDLVDDNADRAGRDVIDDTSPAVLPDYKETKYLIRASKRTRDSTCGACPFAARHSP